MGFRKILPTKSLRDIAQVLSTDTDHDRKLFRAIILNQLLKAKFSMGL